MIARWHIVAMPRQYKTTPLLHAVLSLDWTFAKLLLQQGADQDAHPLKWDYDGLVYGIPNAMMTEVKGIFQHLISKQQRGLPL